MLFGSSAPKFVVGVSTLLLDYVVVEKDEPVLDMVEQKSKLTGHKAFFIKGKHWEYHLSQHIFKMTGGADKTYYQNAKNNFEGQIGSLHRHRDASAFASQFILYSVEEYYLSKYKQEDVIIYKFKSVDYVDITDTLI